MADKKIRVLFFLPSLAAGGAERVVLTLLRNLSRDRFEVSLAVVNDKGAVLASELPPDIKVYDLDSGRLRFALARAAKIIWKLKPDIVFSTIDYLNVALGSSRRLWPRYTAFVARPAILFSADLKTRRRPLVWQFLHRFSVCRADLVVFQSHAMEEDYRQALGWKGESAVVIHNPLDVDLIRKRSRQVTSTGFAPDRFNLVAAGRLEDQKGFDVAIEAVGLCRNRNVTLTVLGDGKLRQTLESLIRERNLQDRVRLLGYTPNPYPFYAQADGFLLSSRFEGFPNVVLEALTCGTPVVATPVAGLSSTLRSVPECRVAIDHSASALACEIDQLANVGRFRVRSDAVGSFDVQHIVGEYERALTRIDRRQSRDQRFVQAVSYD